ncbi:MAG TPA: type II toxin-antitoxin system VapC family toxin [Dehalococcoidia bacterium]|nr:type II toxin-antitoxin system VapC family toxin [Dehalococcoidia bacterium]
MAFVLDTSITMAWCFPDEGGPLTERILDQLLTTGAFVPAIWPLEVANAVLVAERRSRVTAPMVRRFIEDLESFPITVSAIGQTEVLHEVLNVAREQKLTAYDAAYLELAMREGLPLATLDEQLRNAAMRVGVSLVW